MKSVACVAAWAAGVMLVVFPLYSSDIPPAPSAPVVTVGEDGCLTGRADLEKRRRGDHGVINPDLLLERTREFQQQMIYNSGTAIPGTNWVSLGPTNGAGRALSIATHPTVAGTAYVGTAGGGVWKTTDSGANWTALSDTLPNLSVGAIALAPSSPTTIYAATGEPLDFDGIPGIGLLVSTNGGTSWTLPNSVIATAFYSVNVHPTNAQELLVGTDNGALRSTAGQNGPWTSVILGTAAGATPGYGAVSQIVRDPTNSQVLYAATYDRGYWCARYSCANVSSSTVLKSTDGGQTWNPANTNLPQSTFDGYVSRIGLAIAPSSPQTLYASLSIYSGVNGVTISHIYKSTNGGGSWSDTSLSSYGDTSINNYHGQQTWYDNTIAVSPSNANVVLAGGVYYVTSSDGGGTWTHPAFASGGVHVDAHDLRFDAGGTLMIACDGGIWTSTDNGANVTDRNANLVTRQYYSVSTDSIRHNRILGGTQDNGTNLRPDTGSSAWSNFFGGDGFQGGFNANIPSIAYASFQYGQIYRTLGSADDFPSFTKTTPLFTGADNNPFFTRFYFDPNNPLVAFTSSYRLWQSSSAGDVWTPLPTTTTDGSSWTSSAFISDMAVSKSNPLVIMAGVNGSIFRSTDGGNTWASTANTLGGYPNCVEIDPTDANTAYVGISGMVGTRLYYTTNGGTTWTARGTGLPLFAVHVVRVDPTDHNTLYAGTDVGVYRSTNQGLSWTQFGSGLPAVAVWDLSILPDGSALRAGSHGRGRWELSITGNTNSAPAVAITKPSSPTTVNRGGYVSFLGTVTDPNGDSTTSVWTFQDTWRTTETAGGTTSAAHQFNRPGVFKVALTGIDSSGAKGEAETTVTVLSDGDSCAAPAVLPGAGPFPYTLSLSTAGTTSDANDPATGGGCYPYSFRPPLWVSFTPSTSGNYTFSTCGSQVAAVVVGYTGAACGPYTQTGFCYINTNPRDCATDPTVTYFVGAGTTLRLLVASYYSNSDGPVQLTVTNSSLSPSIAAVTPSTGSTPGGTAVVISGSGFTGGMTLTFDGTAATAVSVLTPNVMTATSPAHAVGAVDVVVNGSTTLHNGFTYVSTLARPVLSATASSTSQVALSWGAIANADHYEISRYQSGSYGVIGTTVGTSYNDGGRSADTSYVYIVRAVGLANAYGPYSAPDIATTTLFTDDPLVANTTSIKAAHLTQLRTAVNSLRAAAGLGAATFTDSSLAGVRVKPVHITELRSALNSAIAALNLPPLAYTHAISTNVPISTVDVTEIRNALK
jgi:photosystem II stability/assembly factor-like uncharacterized protein